MGQKECEEAVSDNRPVNLDLSQFSFPLPAITSVIHRATGLILFVGVAFVLWAFQESLSGEESFNAIKSVMQGFLAKLILWGILSALLYHLVAGTKHLLMDMGVGESLEGGKLGAKITLVVSIVLILITGVWIW